MHLKGGKASLIGIELHYLAVSQRHTLLTLGKKTAIYWQEGLNVVIQTLVKTTTALLFLTLRDKNNIQGEVSMSRKELSCLPLKLEPTDLHKNAVLVEEGTLRNIREGLHWERGAGGNWQVSLESTCWYRL